MNGEARNVLNNLLTNILHLQTARRVILLLNISTDQKPYHSGEYSFINLYQEDFKNGAT